LDSVIRRLRLTPLAALFVVLVIAPTMLGPMSTEVFGQASTGPAPGVSLGTDSRSGHRYIRVAGRGAPIYPTIDLSCDGRRWTLTLTRAEDGAVYQLSRDNVEMMLNAIDCRVFLPDQEVALPREQLWGAWAGPAQGPGAPTVLVGQVVDVIDATTILVNMGERSETVRYIGISSQENRRPASPEAVPGDAVQANRQLVARQQVRMELDAVERDRDGRLLAYVYVADKMVNAELVRRGSAEVMTVQPNVRHRDLFITLEQEARDNRRGLWADPSEPTTPTNVEPVRQVAQRPGVYPSENGWACPATHSIKGQFTTYTAGGRCVYHLPDSERYSATKADRCYATVEDARQEGCVASRR
jgi:micrococcal nuclease